MATINEQEHLIQVLKFTPRTYKVLMWGYGGEYVMGSVDRKIYDYFRQRRLDVSEFAWSEDYAEENNIPEDMWPFYPGSWHDCDNMGHCHGVDRSAGTLQILDENDNVIYEKSLEDIDGCDDSPQWGSGDEVWIDSQPKGTPVFIGVSGEKGTFFEGEIKLTEPFDINKLELGYDEIDGNEIVNMVTYDDQEIDNWGGSTNGKSTDFGFYIAGSQKNGSWERYSRMEDINYGLTDWFDAKIVPERLGTYEVETKEGHTYHAEWTGDIWKNSWSEDALKIKKWRGVAYDPDEHFLREELDNLYLEFNN